MGVKMKTVFWLVLLLALGVGGRLMHHLPNLTPNLAIAVFAGAVLPGPLALLTPLLAMFLGDLALGFHDQMAVVYISLLPLVWLGTRRGPGFLLQSILASGFFFITTNLAVWWQSGMYAHTAADLQRCFVLALPFLGYSFAATALYLGGLTLVDRLFGRVHLNKQNAYHR